MKVFRFLEINRRNKLKKLKNTYCLFPFEKINIKEK